MFKHKYLVKTRTEPQKKISNVFICTDFLYLFLFTLNQMYKLGKVKLMCFVPTWKTKTQFCLFVYFFI